MVFAVRSTRAFDGRKAVAGGVTVVVDDGRIISVESSAGELPSDCPLVEPGPNSTLLPGLFDMHVHLCCDSGLGAVDRLGVTGPEEIHASIEQALTQQLDAGVTTVRDVGDRDWAVVERRSGQSTGMGPSPTILASGPPITVPQGHCSSWGGAVSGTVGLAQAITERAERGVDFVKVMASGGLTTEGADPAQCQFSADELRFVVSAAHEAGLPITAHAHPLAAVEQAIDAGVDGIEHCSCTTENGMVADDQLLMRIASSGITVCPTNGRVPDVDVPPNIAAQRKRLGISDEAKRDWIRRAHDAGVKMVAGVDSGIGPGKRHGALPHIIVDLVAAGISPADALAASTSEAAAVCGLGRTKGRIAAGFDADLIVIEGDPLADITALTRVRAVYARGVEHRIST